MTPSNRYRYAGLTVASALPLPELMPDDSTATVDVSVHLESLSTQAQATLSQRPFFRAGDLVYLRVDGVCDMVIERGARICLAPAVGVPDTLLRVYLLGTAFGVLLHQRGYLPLHAAGLETSAGCVAIAGDSGAGKSTTAAALRARGLRMVCDDVLAIDPNACIALPGYPQTKLWADTAAALGVSTTGCERVDPVREKFRVPLHPQRQFRAQPQSFTRLYELVDRDDAIEIRALTGVAALAAITRNTYRAFLLDLLERVPEHVRDAGALLRRARVFHVYRPRDLSRLPALVDALLEHFEDGHI